MAGGIVEVPLHDFSGGYTPRLASTEFTERQWSRLKGVVLDSAAVVRTQWACQRVGTATGFKQVDAVGRWLIGIKDDGTVWWAVFPVSDDTWDVSRTAVWTQLAGITANTKLRAICRIPLPDVEASQVMFGLLLNSVDDTKPAYAIYDTGIGTTPSLKTWSKRYPAAAPDTNTMPAANVGALWADFLVLGDIIWTGGALPAYPHVHAVWFSEPAVPDSWDAVNVVRTTPTGLTNRRVLGLVSIDAGMLVFTGSGVFLLRGLANDHSFEEVRFSIAGRVPDGPCYWPATGGAAWITNAGEVWQTNGEQFGRLDDHLFLDRSAGIHDMVRAWGQYLIAERDGKLLCFTLFDEEGSWTELVTPGGGKVKSLFPSGDQFYFIDSADGAVWRYNRREDATFNERGLMDGTAITATVSTRTLEASDGHHTTMWHRFGFRAEGPGTVESVVVRPGPALDDTVPLLTYALNAPVNVRHELVVPGHGPSVEASATITVVGDVSLEQVSFWHHRGRGSR